MKLLDRAWLHHLLGFVVGAVFLYASVDKILHPADFARILYHYQLIGPSQSIPPVVPNTFAVTLPWVEVATALLLIFGLWRREAAVVSAGMLVSFLGAVSIALARGIDIENCGCFSVSGAGRSAGLMLLAGDTLLLLASLALVRGPRAAAARAEEAGPAPDAAAAELR